jgi:hypothetical protein
LATAATASPGVRIFSATIGAAASTAHTASDQWNGRKITPAALRSAMA